MFGLFYLGWSVISHIGYSVKSFIHDSTAKIDKRTGTYYGLDGRLKDANSNKTVIWTTDSKGDEILLDSHNNLYKNISEEEREKGWNNAKKNLKDGVTVYDTHQVRSLKVKDEYGNISYRMGRIYKDLKTGTEYAKRKINVDYHGYHGEEIEFYVKATNPYSLVRMTDEQIHLEKIKEKKGKYSWTKYPDDAVWFIYKYSEEPISALGIKNSNFTFSN